MIIDKLYAENLINPPKWIFQNVAFLTMMGSSVYGASNDSSDMDVYGFCIPPKADIFPYSTGGYVLGFGQAPNAFQQWQQHHIKYNTKEYDFAVYSIVKFFHLAMGAAPNMLDALFTPRNAILHITDVGQHVRDNRHVFVHKGCYSKFRGYALSQMSKVRSKTKPTNEKRAVTVEQFGYDLKYAMHLVRLICECEQLLETGSMVLDKDAALYRKVRTGEWTLEYLEEWFAAKERHLEEVLNRSKIPFAPDEAAIKQVLINCLEMHYGDLSSAITNIGQDQKLIQEMRGLLGKYGY